MGGCCCGASQRAESDRTPVYFYCPQEPEENEPLSASHFTSTAVPGGLLVDTNLDTSSPDTYRAPPVPLPYNSGLTGSQTTHGNIENCGNKTAHVQSTDLLSSGEIASPGENLKGFDRKSKGDYVHEFPRLEEDEDEISKLKDAKSPVTEEEDVCPTCLEDYDLENPRIITKCEHHFHLACILEWMERSNTCPICDQIMVIDHTCED